MNELALTDRDRIFLRICGIAIPEDARWEIDVDTAEEIDLLHDAAATIKAAQRALSDATGFPSDSEAAF